MLLRMGLLLRLGPNVITDGTFITLGSNYYTCAFYTYPGRILSYFSEIFTLLCLNSSWVAVENAEIQFQCTKTNKALKSSEI